MTAFPLLLILAIAVLVILGVIIFAFSSSHHE